MKAMTYTRYGPPKVLKLTELEKPIPRDDEVLIKTRAMTVTSGDVRMRLGSRKSLPLWPISKLAIGITKPRNTILGFDAAGEIEAIGKNVTRFKVGDQVMVAGHQSNAEYLIKKQDGLITLKPNTVSFEEATTLAFGGISALHFLEAGKIESGKTVLIYGASGAVGTYAVQLAKVLGAEVTAVCSGANLELVKSLGADFAIDYKKQDFHKNEKVYDIIFDTVGKTKYSDNVKSLSSVGICVFTVFNYRELFQMLWSHLFTKKKLHCSVATDSLERLNYLKGLLESGKIVAVIDKVFSFEDIPKAHSYIETGRKKGQVVIGMDLNTDL